MPELPEVETIRRGMEKLVVGQSVTGVEILVPKIVKPPITEPDDFARILISSRFVNARRQGKHLIFGLDSGYALYAHLKMRGQVVVALKKEELPRAKYLCLAIGLETGAELRYHDIWTWGEIRLLPDDQKDFLKYVPGLAALGPEPVEETFDGVALKKSAASRAGSPIKTVLLDQSVVAGVGNIYADESLFRAGISPLRKSSTLSDVEWQMLARQIRVVLLEAIAGGGTLSDNYVDVEGVVGRYRPLVYGRAKEQCKTCDSPLVGSRLGGRSTVYCPQCQI
jgi:formamidopyrimidine-DNA glycosylase